MTLRIATIGRNGQVARSLAACAALTPDIALTQGGRDVADLADADSLARFIDGAAPGIVINTGAYNLVDKAETEQREAFAINADGPRALARICGERDIPFIHMSTDCVFDGRKTGPYMADDEPNPLSVYGASKLAGEMAVLEDNPAAIVTRVCWVFSEYGDNFVSKMIELARTRPVLRVVNDQVGPPTYAPDIAEALVRMARRKVDQPQNLCSLFHLAAPDPIDRATMARAIFAESARQGGPVAEVEGVPTADYPTPAKRPLNAHLSGEVADSVLGLAWTPWPEALERAVRGVLARS